MGDSFRPGRTFLSLAALWMPGLCLGVYFCLAPGRILGKEFVPWVFNALGGKFKGVFLIVEGARGAGLSNWGA